MDHPLLIVLLLVTSGCIVMSEGAKMLAFPVTFFKNSALRNDEKILSMLAEHGHEIFLLADDAYRPPEFLVKSGIKLITFPRPDGLPPVDLKFTLKNMTDDFMSVISSTLSVPLALCESLLSSTDVLDRIRHEQFDVVFYDAASFCKSAVQGVIGNVPSVEFLALDVIWRAEIRELPIVPSYMPASVYHVGQDMTFKERVLNSVFHLIVITITGKMNYDVGNIARKYGIEARMPESLGLVFGGFPMEYPAPILPDMVYLNGILVSQPKPLEPEMEAFVQSSGEHGIIMMSFGSMIKEYDAHHGNLIAEAFARMPQKVLWKYDGPTPKTLGKNTKLVKWLPQTSLLAHPKTRVFLTHCGQNSAYETIVYGVPVVALPIFGDQPQNAARLTLSHRAGVQVDLKTLTVDRLVEALTEVINNPVYKENAKRLSGYLKDQPIAGKDLLLYWVDYVIRHKGVSHLKPYGRFLPWYQFYSLDVAAFLIAVTVIICSLLYKCCVCTCRRCCKRSLKTKKE